MNIDKIQSLYRAKQIGQLLLLDDIDSLLEQSYFVPLDSEVENKELIAYWWMWIYNPKKSSSYEVYKSWHNAFSEYFKYLYQSGYNPFTNQSVVKLMCLRDHSTREHIEELSYFLDYIKLSSSNNGRSDELAKYIGIFEHTCSEFGVYSLYVYDDSRIELEKTVWGSTYVLETFHSLFDAIDYIRANHYYE